MYYGNKMLKIYGKKDCPIRERMRYEGRKVPTTLLPTKAIAKLRGYRPCMCCMPIKQRNTAIDKTKRGTYSG